MAMGTKVLHGKCSKQELNVKSSTKAKLLVSEYIPYDLWFFPLSVNRDVQ